MLYYPEHLKYADVDSEEHEALLSPPSLKRRLKSPEWRRSIVVAWIAAIHLCVRPLHTLAAICFSNPHI